VPSHNFVVLLDVTYLTCSRARQLRLTGRVQLPLLAPLPLPQLRSQHLLCLQPLLPLCSRLLPHRYAPYACLVCRYVLVCMCHVHQQIKNVHQQIKMADAASGTPICLWQVPLLLQCCVGYGVAKFCRCFLFCFSHCTQLRPCTC